MDSRLTLRQVLYIVSTFLCLCQLGSSQDVCTNTWITYPNANVAGGTEATGVVLVKKCQERCLKVNGCTGIDFDGASKCWVIRTDARPKDDATSRTTHYDILKNVTACTATCNVTSAVTWRHTNNSHIAGGTPGKVDKFEDCLAICRDNDACKSFDWDATSTTEKCWIITNDNVLQEAAGVRNFKRDCFFGGVKIVTPALIPIGEQGGSPMLSGLTTYSTTSGGGDNNPNFPGSVVVDDYVSGGVFTIKPAYIVLLGMGLGCILLVVIAILVICLYPMRGAGKGKKFSMGKLGKKSTKTKKVKKESGELHTRRPKALAEDEIGMHTAKTSLPDSTYDHHKLYSEKKNINSMYDETNLRDSYNNETKKIRDTYNDVSPKDTYVDNKVPYHHNQNGTIDKNPLPAYTSHHEHVDNVANQRHSLDMDDIPGDRNSALHQIEDKYRGSKNSNYDRVEDEIHDIMDNPTFKKDEDYD